jgi:hypothetical protein
MINEKSNSINKIVSEKIDIFQPKLLRIKHKNILDESPVDKQYILEKQKLAEKLELLKESKKQIESKEYKTELQERVTSFYKNPFQFMDYIIEKYCNINLIVVENQFAQFKKEDLYQKILSDFSNYCEETRENNMIYIQNEMQKLKEYRSRILSSRDIEHHEMASEPVEQKEIFSVMSNDKFEKFKSVVSSRTDVKQSLLNNKYSNLGKHNIVRKTLDCLKGDRVIPPTQKFLEVRDIEIEDVDLEEYEYAKNIYDINKAFESFKNENEGMIFKHVEKTIKQEEKIFDDLLNKANKKLNKMEKDAKISEEILKYVKDKLDEDFNKEALKMGIKRLNLYDDNLAIINQQLKQEDIVLTRDRLNLLNENNKKALETADKYFKEDKKESLDNLVKLFESNELTDSKLEDMYKKYKPNNTKKNNKFTFSSAPVSMSYVQKKIIRTTTNMKPKAKKI